MASSYSTPANRKKAMTILLVTLAVLFFCVFVVKMIEHFFIGRAIAAARNRPITVSTTQVTLQQWQPFVTAVGSLRAVEGVNVTTELAGMVRTIYFKPGSDVKRGELLVDLNTDSDVAQLHSLQAQAKLSQITYRRDKEQFAIGAVSKQTLDTDLATLNSDEAQVEEQAAIVEKKIIHAPFNGRLGVSAINPGQYLNPGDKIVNLQSLNPIYVDFYLPQQMLNRISTGMWVTVTSDTFPSRAFKGRITTIEPMVDPATRNVEVEVTLVNSHYLLKPGMFVYAKVKNGLVRKRMTLPQTAISFNPYGEFVYIVSATKKKKGEYTVQQTPVTVGETRGDQITVLSGVKVGDTVVSAGQLNLRNGSRVVINNKIRPSESANPQLPEE